VHAQGIFGETGLVERLWAWLKREITSNYKTWKA